MPTHENQSADEAEESDRSTKGRARSMLRKRRRDGSLALLAGTAMLAWAARTVRRSWARAGLQALAGVALLAVGRRQRLGKRREDRIETGADAERTASGEKAASDHAHTEAEHDLGAGRVADEAASVYQSENEPNPCGMTDREAVEGDLSESAMADENSEAAGPQPEQAYPAQEGTDPEPTAEEAPERGAKADDSDRPSPDAETDDVATAESDESDDRA
jgi:hypothetical protein